jgi:hypothetical protein
MKKGEPSSAFTETWQWHLKNNKKNKKKKEKGASSPSTRI